MIGCTLVRWPLLPRLLHGDAGAAPKASKHCPQPAQGIEGSGQPLTTGCQAAQRPARLFGLIFLRLKHAIVSAFDHFHNVCPTVLSTLTSPASLSTSTRPAPEARHSDARTRPANAAGGSTWAFLRGSVAALTECVLW